MDGSAVAANVLPQPEHRTGRPFEELLASFNQKPITYCYWRSGRRLEAAFAGESDLDLLVAKRDQYRARESLLQCGFKCFPAVAHRDHPAISSFLRYDEVSGRIVHVHLHVRLVVGGALLKTHRVQWEEMILARAVCHPTLPIRTLDQVDEALLMVVRTCLELRWTDPVALRGWAALTRKFATDRAALAAQLDRATVLTRARDVFPEDLAGLVTEAVFAPPSHGAMRRLRRLLGRELAAWRTLGPIEECLRNVVCTALWVAAQVDARRFVWPDRGGAGRPAADAWSLSSVWTEAERQRS